jgi:hypothetical protein
MSFLGTLLGGAAGFMLGGPTGAAIGAGIGGGVDAANASKQAANVQAQSADQATQLQRDMFNKQVELQQPWQQAGANALNKLQGLADYTMFGPEQFAKDPGYGFRLAEGQKALDRQAAARGGLISGGALKAATRYGQDMGSQEYQNAFNRYQIERNAQLGPWQSLAGVGQTSANTMTNAAGNFASNAGNNIMSAGNARASGYVGGANAMAGGLSSAANIYQNNQLLQRFGNQTPNINALQGQLGAAPSAPAGYDWGTMMSPYNG